MKTNSVQYFKSPIGLLKLEANHEVLISCQFVARIEKQIDNANLILKKALKELKAFFNGELKTFTTPLQLEKGFAQKVYQTIQVLPMNCLISYKGIGVKINSQAYRAIGSILARNKIVIFIPCHKVIKSNGLIGNYTIANNPFNSDIKAKLIDFERINYLNSLIRRKIFFSNQEINYFNSHNDFKRVLKTVSIKNYYYGYEDPFNCLISQVIYQQISYQVAQKIESLFYQIFNWTIDCKTILSTNDKMVLQCGLSKRKWEYIKNIALFVQQNPLIWKKILLSKDQNFIFNHLIKIKGVGKWTIKIFLLFGLNLKNIIYIDDLIILKTIKSLGYESFESIQNFIERHQCFGSIVAINLWNYFKNKD